MNELVYSNNKGRDVTTSLIVAEVFGKRHADVLRDIEQLSCSQDFRERNFALSSYVSEQGKSLPMYEITKDGFSFLVMGYTGEKADWFKERFINEFNKREALLMNDDYIIGRAMRVITERTKILEEANKKLETVTNEQAKSIAESAPKVLFADAVATSNTSILIGELAKILKQNGIEIGQNRLFDWLRKNGYLCNRKGEMYNMPTQYAMDLGLLEIKKSVIEQPNGTIFMIRTPKVSPKGQIYYVNKFLNDQVI